MKRKHVLLASVGGAASTDIHLTLQAAAYECGLHPDSLNWYRVANGEKITSKKDTRRFYCNVKHLLHLNKVVRGFNPQDMSLVLIGKSAGGVDVYELLRRYYYSLIQTHPVLRSIPGMAKNLFSRCSLVIVDGHGAATGDNNFGPYCDRQNFSWPRHWTRNRKKLRVYNIFQQLEAGSGIVKKLSGASFPAPQVVINRRLNKPGLNHLTIESQPEVKQLIKKAISFARSGY